MKFFLKFGNKFPRNCKEDLNSMYIFKIKQCTWCFIKGIGGGGGGGDQRSFCVHVKLIYMFITLCFYNSFFVIIICRSLCISLQIVI